MMRSSARWWSSGGSRARPSRSLRSSSHRARSSPVRLLPSAKPCARATRKASTPAGPDRVVDPVYRTESPLDTLEVIRFAEPFVGLPCRSVDGDRERERGRLNNLEGIRASRGTRLGGLRARRDHRRRASRCDAPLAVRLRSSRAAYRSNAGPICRRPRAPRDVPRLQSERPKSGSSIDRSMTGRASGWRSSTTAWWLSR